MAEYALKSISALSIKMSNKFENQFVSKYTPRIFPWALNYDCGGAEYPDLFTDWEEILRGDQECVVPSLEKRWRRLTNEAPLLPGEYARMLATRPETQVAGDWMVVPAARNLHWRYAVLHSAFLVCKQKVAPGETLNQNLADLIEATEKVWKRISSNTVRINGVKKNINGNIQMLFAAEDLTSAERIILRSYLNTTASIAGCQQIRKKVGAYCFGLRVVLGECIFVTVSPNRRHSSMVLKLSRARLSPPYYDFNQLWCWSHGRSVPAWCSHSVNNLIVLQNICTLQVRPPEYYTLKYREEAKHLVEGTYAHTHDGRSTVAEYSVRSNQL